MALIDLQPLTKEKIQEMNLDTHDLWVVKLSDEIFGPFQGEVLKKYAETHIDLLMEAQASRLNLNYWAPFFNHAFFDGIIPAEKRIKVYEGPFWLMKDGLKTGPFYKKDLEKKLSAGTLVLTDVMSSDDGYSWKKVFEFEAFSTKLLSASELPFTPSEASFHKAKIHVLDLIEARAGKSNPGEELAILALQQAAKASAAPKVDEIPVMMNPEPAVATTLNWMVPMAVGIVLTITASTIYFIVSPNMEEEAEVSITIPVIRKKSSSTVTKAKIEPESKTETEATVKEEPTRRTPASLRRARLNRDSDYAMGSDSQYPTHTDTLQNENNLEVEQVGEPVADSEAEIQEHTEEQLDRPQRKGRKRTRKTASEEHSLIGRDVEPTERDADAATSGKEFPGEAVDEASDF